MSDQLPIAPMTKLDTFSGSRIQQTWYRLRDLDTGRTPVALYRQALLRSLEDIRQALEHLDANGPQIAAGQEQLMWERIERSNEADDDGRIGS